MRRIPIILILFASTLVSAAGSTNYVCVVCGKGPLVGTVWMSKWGAVCDPCRQLENRCSLCGLPVRDGGETMKTGDGRYICRFDKKEAVLDVDMARDVFSEAQRDLASLFGPGFALKFPEVSVNLFDVDYWTEKGRGDGLHKFGFCSTRKTASGKCTHQVVMLSGQFRDDLAMTAAHEYTHLWINENRPDKRAIDGDVIEAICELAAYELMESRRRPAQLKRILANPYTHGNITNLVELDRQHGFRYVLDWVREGDSPNFEPAVAAAAVPAKMPGMTFTNVPAPLPPSLKLGGLLLDGKVKHAVVSGVTFAAGETRPVRLRQREVLVRCREIQRAAVVLEVDGSGETVTLKIGEEKFLP